MDANNSPLNWSGHFRATVLLGLPLIGGHLAQMLVHLTDTIMVGWYGVEDLAAVVLAGSMYFAFFIVGSGFAFAVMPMVALAAGAHDDVRVRRVTRMGLWISMFYTVVLMPVLWNFEAMMVAIGQKPEVAALAGEYMRIAQWGMFPAMLIMVLKSYLSALERPGWVLWASIVGALANVGFNYAFIFGNWGAPELGVRGAALASLGTQSVSAAVVLGYAALARDLRKYSLFQRIWRSDWPAFGEVFRLGWPIGLTMLAEVGLFTTGAVMMGWIGTRELATHGIAIQIASMSFMVYLGLSNVATIRAGNALGRKDRLGIVRAGGVVVALQLATAGIVILIFLLFPEQLISAFLDNSDPDAAAIVLYGSSLLIVAAAFQVVDGLQVVMLALLRGLQDTRIPMICALVSYWPLGLFSSYVLGFWFGFGGHGVWWGLVIGLTAAALSLGWRFYIVMRGLDFR